MIRSQSWSRSFWTHPSEKLACAVGFDKVCGMKWLIALLAGLVGAGVLGGCKKPAEGDPECRIFEKDPEQVSDRGTLEQIRAALDDMERVRRCAQAAGRRVDEFMKEHRVQERLRLVRDKLGELRTTAEQLGAKAAAAGQTLLDQAQQAVERAREGARQAIDEAQRRLQQGVQAVTGQ